MNCEVCVLGGGPAGAAFALRLAQIGHQVVVVEKHPFPRPHIGESLPPGILPLLQTLGLRLKIESAGFLRPRRAIIRWGEERQRDPASWQEPGFQVDRGLFDQILLQAAAQAGATILQPAQAGCPTRNGPADWRIPVRHNGSRREIRSRFIADASGRRALLRGRNVRYSAPTLAMYAYWPQSPLCGLETRVEAGRSQWYWGAPLPDGSFNATVFIDPRRLGRSNCAKAQSRLEDLYRRLLRSSTLLEGCLEGEPMGAVTACDATSYHAADPVGQDWIKLGETSLSIDPLSSQGVQSAIRSGIQGVAVVNTLIRYPENGQTALEFYRQRQQETIRRHRALSAQFYGEMAQVSPGPFWQARAKSSTAASATTQVRASRGLRRAFRPEEKLMLSADAKILQTPVMEGNRIVPRRALTHPSLDRPVAFLGGIDLAPLLEGLGNAQAACRILDRWSLQMSPEKALRILLWLWEKAIVSSVER